ncbi:MAG TPA: MinD/ParA family protein [Actinomadura sp.]|nr:MinD/ParA family protein [Actinomadura sp.]
MAKNEQDGRSLEEQLASLDALTNEAAPEPQSGGAEPQAGGTERSPDEPDRSRPDDSNPTSGETPAAADATVIFPSNPWLNNQPPPFAEQPPAPPYGAPGPEVSGPGQGGPPPGQGGPRPDHASMPPGHLPPPPEFGPPHYTPNNFYPSAPSAGGQQPPPLEPLPDYAPEQSRPGPPEGQQPYPWAGPAYEPQQGEAPGQPNAYGPPQGDAPGQPSYGPPGTPGPYGYPQGSAPAGPAPYGPPHAGPQAGGPYVPPQQPSPIPPPPGMGLTRQPPAGGPQTSDSLSADTLLRNRRSAPASGWRRMVYKATAGTVHPGEAPSEIRRRELLARARTPVAGGHHRVAVMSLKGGVGKTTTTVGLGSTLASVRGDRVVAVDANPDRGTLSDKVRLETAATVRDLLNERERIQRYADVRAFTSQASSRLEVLASDRDPAVSEAFSEDDYRAVAKVLEHYYSICLTDCGTGLLHSAMAGVLALADQLVLVSSPSVDGARSASATLDWLEAHGHGDLVRGGVVVLSMVRSRSKSTVDLDRLQQHFESRSRAVVRLPYDPHLEEGAEVELDQLTAATQDAYLVLAATIGDGFARQR